MAINMLALEQLYAPYVLEKRFDDEYFLHLSFKSIQQVL